MERQLQLPGEYGFPSQCTAARLPGRSHEQIRWAEHLKQGRARRQPTRHLSRPPDRGRRWREASLAEHVEGEAPRAKSVHFAATSAAATATTTAAATGWCPTIYAPTRLPWSEAECEDAGAGRTGRCGSRPRTRRADVLWRRKPATAACWWRTVQFGTAMEWRRRFCWEPRTIHERFPRTSEPANHDRYVKHIFMCTRTRLHYYY